MQCLSCTLPTGNIRYQVIPYTSRRISVLSVLSVAALAAAAKSSNVAAPFRVTAIPSWGPWPAGPRTRGTSCD